MSRKENTNKTQSQVIMLHSLDEAVRVLKEIAKKRFESLANLTEDDAKQFTSFIANISNFVNAQAKKPEEKDRRIEWMNQMDEFIKEAYQKKDIGAVLTYTQNILFICEQMINEGKTEQLTEYCKRIIGLSVLHERLNITANNANLAERASKYIEQVETTQQLECLVGVIERDAIFQFSKKNFEQSTKNHIVIFNAREKALASKNFTTDKEAEAKLKFSQIKTAGNVVAALSEEGRADEALEYFEKGVAYEQDGEVAKLLQTPDGNRALAGLYMNASSSYNHKKDRVKEKELLDKALSFIAENEEKDEEDDNSKNALFRRRINSLIALNEENKWYSSSKEYQDTVKAAIQLADSNLKECMNGKESLEAATHIEEAIESLEELHAVDLIVSSVRLAKFCQICGDLHRRFKDAPSINKYWYQKTVDILRGLQQDDIQFDLNDLAISLFFLALYEKDHDMEQAIEYQRQSIFLFEQLSEKGKIRDKNNLAMGYYNLAVNLANHDEIETVEENARLALGLWNELIEKENRKELQPLVEPCKQLIEWVRSQG